jgi:hypothetical protein
MWVDWSVRTSKHMRRVMLHFVLLKYLALLQRKTVTTVYRLVIVQYRWKRWSL